MDKLLKSKKAEETDWTARASLWYMVFAIVLAISMVFFSGFVTTDTRIQAEIPHGIEAMIQNVGLFYTKDCFLQSPDDVTITKAFTIDLEKFSKDTLESCRRTVHPQKIVLQIFDEEQSIETSDWIQDRTTTQKVLEKNVIVIDMDQRLTARLQVYLQ